MLEADHPLPLSSLHAGNKGTLELDVFALQQVTADTGHALVLGAFMHSLCWVKNLVCKNQNRSLV